MGAINNRDMKKIIMGYRKVFDLANEMKDIVVAARMVRFLLLFFILGILIGRLLPYFI